ncbi:MAG: type II toxin-antitoxin system VapC family toxin [Anaerolineae bacterium]|nr:type II toxin-antitoxin system VapC family toxin [Anaerolineae bacterium]
MRVLLDTHTFIWWDADKKPGRLSPKAFDVLSDSSNSLVVSLATIWEIQIKVQLGKLKLPSPLTDILNQQQQANGIELFPVNVMHILALDTLPHHHRDPFDRILVAQAKVENIPLVSKDSVFTQYSIPVLW